MNTPKHHPQNPPRTLTPLTAFLGLFLYIFLIFALQRLGFLWMVKESISSEPLRHITKAFDLGLRFDGRMATLITMPLGVLLGFPPIRRFLGRHKGLLSLGSLFIVLGLWAICFTDIAFFQYLAERLNATFMELAVDFQDGLVMVWESYPVVLLGLTLLALTLVTWLPLAYAIRSFSIRSYMSKKKAAGAWGLALVFCTLTIFGQISTNFFPLRWSQAYFSQNPHITALALNPLQNVYDTLAAAGDDSIDLDAVRHHYPLMAEYLHVDAPNIDALTFSRQHRVTTPAPNKPNVVIIIMESFSWSKSSLAPGKSHHTPFIESLTKESVYFPNFFANARTTARGVFSTMTGIPDVTQSSTGSRNQRVIDQRVVANEFDGYQKYYMLGGNTNWANIRGVIAGNIEGITILEEGFWKASNIDVWGIHDYDLLMEAHDFMDQLDEPFLSIIQTASFHKPFTLPNHVPFTREPLDEETRVNYGFVNEDEYNGFRFFDHTLQVFFEKAKNSVYYDNTIFILFGDHGISESSPNTSASYQAARLSPWHVPLVIHAPWLLTPEVREEAASQVDVFPTAASLAGIDYTNWTLGRDLFDKRRDPKQQAAFISGKNDVPIRLIMNGYCFVDNRAGQQFLYDLAGEAIDLQKELPELFATMRDLAMAHQTTAKYLLYNNKKSPQARP